MAGWYIFGDGSKEKSVDRGIKGKKSMKLFIDFFLNQKGNVMSKTNRRIIFIVLFYLLLLKYC